jgi:hypothetical protein
MYDCNTIETVNRMITTEIQTLSQIVLYAAQIFQLLSNLVLRIVWSDEVRLVFGSNMFYPVVASTALFAVAYLVPRGALKKCTGYCMRRAVALKKWIRSFMSGKAASKGLVAIKKADLIATAISMVGTANVLLF